MGNLNVMSSSEWVIFENWCRLLWHKPKPAVSHTALLILIVLITLNKTKYLKCTSGCSKTWSTLFTRKFLSASLDQFLHTLCERSVSWLFHRAHPVRIHSTSWVWWVIYHSQSVCSAGVADHPGTAVEGADCEMVVEGGGPCEGMLLEKRWGYL